MLKEKIMYELSNLREELLEKIDGSSSQSANQKYVDYIKALDDAFRIVKTNYIPVYRFSAEKCLKHLLENNTTINLDAIEWIFDCDNQIANLNECSIIAKSGTRFGILKDWCIEVEE